MARKRMIDPDIWTDERVLELPWDAVPFYIGLISQADDDGRLKWSARSLRARICPRDNVSVDDVGQWMWVIAYVGLAQVYESEGALFALLPGWRDYQKVQHPSPSTLPQPPENLPEVSRVLTNLHEDSRTFVNPHESSPQVRSIRLDRSGRGGGAKNRATPGDELPPPPEFGDLEPDVTGYIATLAAENKTGTIAATRELSVRRDLAAQLEELGREAFLYGLRECTGRGKANLNYLRACAKNYKPSNVTPMRPKSRVRNLVERECSRCHAVQGGYEADPFVCADCVEHASA